jgi:hypothetical protein
MPIDQRLACNLCENLDREKLKANPERSTLFCCKVWNKMNEYEQNELRGTYMDNCSLLSLTEDAQLQFEEMLVTERIEQKAW